MATLGILRELHRWGAHAMVITIWLHMYRVFLTGSYKPPREFNWGVGVILLVLTLLLSFTGYLLPWDQLAIWAITVGSNMARATPFIGYEGPGSKFLQVGGVELIHSGSDARFLLLGGRFVGEDDAAALLRAALRGPAAGGGVAHRRPFLARAQGRRHQRRVVRQWSVAVAGRRQTALTLTTNSWLGNGPLTTDGDLECMHEPITAYPTPMQTGLGIFYLLVVLMNLGFAAY